MIKIDNQVKHTQTFFDAIHDQYDEKSDYFLSSLETFRNVSSPFIRGDVLDIGNGGIISFDFEKANTVTLSDLSAKMLTHLRRVKHGHFRKVNSKQFTIVQADVRDLPFRAARFDVVLLLTTAHHLSEKSKKQTQINIQQAFNEVARVLKPGGYLLLLECQLASPLKLIQDVFYELAYSFFIRIQKPLPYFMSKAEIRGYLSKQNLNLEEIKHIPSGEKIYLPLFPFITCPGWIWDYLSRSHVFIAQKTQLTSKTAQKKPRRSR